MRRVLLRLLCFLAFVETAALGALWLRSQRVADALWLRTGDTGVAVISSGGHVGVSIYPFPSPRPQVLHKTFNPFPFPCHAPARDHSRAAHGFGLLWNTFDHELWFPQWLPASLTGLLFVLTRAKLLLS